MVTIVPSSYLWVPKCLHFHVMQPKHLRIKWYLESNISTICNRITFQWKDGADLQARMAAQDEGEGRQKALLPVFTILQNRPRRSQSILLRHPPPAPFSISFDPSVAYPLLLLRPSFSAPPASFPSFFFPLSFCFSLLPQLSRPSLVSSPLFWQPPPLLFRFLCDPYAPFLPRLIAFPCP